MVQYLYEKKKKWCWEQIHFNFSLYMRLDDVYLSDSQSYQDIYRVINVYDLVCLATSKEMNMIHTKQKKNKAIKEASS